MDAATIANLILVFLTLVFTAIILIVTVKALKTSGQSLHLQEEQASLLPDVMLSIKEFDFTDGSYLLFEVANIGRIRLTEVHSQVTFDDDLLEPLARRDIWAWWQWSENTVAYDALKRDKVIGVAIGNKTTTVHMLADEIPPGQRRTFRIPVTARSGGRAELGWVVVCAEGARKEGRVAVKLPGDGGAGPNGSQGT